jgi:hypothetical protein
MKQETEKQRRLEDRGLCADLIKMAWVPEPTLPKSDWAILGDISPSGACLEIEEPIPVNAIVVLEFGAERCEAVVQYCKYDKVNYLLGVEFKEGYRWSSNRWEPKHLVQFHLLQAGKLQEAGKP